MFRYYKTRVLFIEDAAKYNCIKAIKFYTEKQKRMCIVFYSGIYSEKITYDKITADDAKKILKKYDLKRNEIKNEIFAFFDIFAFCQALAQKYFLNMSDFIKL